MKQFRTTVVLTLLTPVFLLFAVFAMGGGHGSYEPAAVLFPVGMLSFVFVGVLTTPFIVLAILQYPVYGAIIDSMPSKRARNIAKISILLFHILLVAVVYIFQRSSF